jgi:hypothetical protein
MFEEIVIQHGIATVRLDALEAAGDRRPEEIERAEERDSCREDERGEALHPCMLWKNAPFESSTIM